MKNDPKMMHVNLYRIIFTGLVTMLYLTFVNTTRIVTGSVLSDNHAYTLAVVLSAINYGFGPLFLNYQGPLIQRFFYRFIFYFTSIGNIVSLLCLLFVTLFYKDNEILTSTSVIVLTILSAPMSSLYYCTYNYYINALASRQNKSLYFGIAYSCFFASTLWGAVYGFFFYRNNTGEMYTINILVCFVIASLYWFVKEANQKFQSQTFQEMQDQSLKRDRITKQEQPPTKKAKQQPTVKEEAPKRVKCDTSYKEVFRLMRVEYFVYLIPNLMMIGALQGFLGVNGDRLQSICQEETHTKTNATALIQFAANATTNSSIDINRVYQFKMFDGLGEVLGGITSGLIGDSYGQYQLLLMNQYFIIFSSLLAVFGISLKNCSVINIYYLLLGFSIASQLTTTYSYMAYKYYKYPQLFVLVDFLYCYGQLIISLIFHWLYGTYLQIGVALIIFLAIINCMLLFRYKKHMQELQAKELHDSLT